MKNIVLIGMPGCGKSTVGSLLGLPFYDTDAEIERSEGRTIAEIFDADGEDVFRRIETETVKRLSSRTGVTIATGGGVVKSEDNIRTLKQNGVIVFLNRPLDLIDTSNADRPLLRDPCKLKQLYTERLPLYKRYADIEIINDKTPRQCAKEIKEALK